MVPPACGGPGGWLARIKEAPLLVEKIQGAIRTRPIVKPSRSLPYVIPGRGSGTWLRPLSVRCSATKDLGVSVVVRSNARLGGRVNAKVAGTSKPA